MTTLLQGDALDLLPTLPRKSVQSVVTSPPYFNLRSYGLPPSAWPAIEYMPIAGIPPISIPAWDGCLGEEADPLSFIGHLVHVFRLVWNVLRDDGVVFLNLGDCYAQDKKWGGGLSNAGKNRHSLQGNYRQLRRKTGLKDKDLLGIPHRAAFALQADGWYWRADNVWEKPNCMPESVADRWRCCHEWTGTHP